MRQARRYVAALTAGLLLLTACNGDNNSPEPDPPPIGGEEDDEDDGDEFNEAVDEEDEEPYAVPDEVDEAYAEEVINVLLEIDVEALRIALRQEPGETLDSEAADRVAAISDGRRQAAFLETLQGYVDSPEPPERLLPPTEMSATTFHALQVLHAEPDRCLLVAGWWDLSSTTLDAPDRDEISVFSLSRVDREVTDQGRNPTPWAIRHVAAMADTDGEPIPEDEWSDIEFGDALDRTCEDR